MSTSVERDWARRAAWAAFLVLLVVGGPALAGNGKGQGVGKGGKKVSTAPDTTPPKVVISDPQSSATVAGGIQVSGSASDDVAVASVEIAIDAGAFVPASGGGAWSEPVDTTTLPNGQHAITARATDTAGNVGTAQITIDVENVVAPADTTAPVVKIGSPSEGATVGGTLTASGIASDDTGVSSVEVRIDANAWKTANGSSSWSVAFDTTAFADGSHTVTVRASDAAGNLASTSVSVTFSNTVVTATSSSQLVTPEGVTIDVDSAGGWTAQQIYDLLKQSAYQLNLVGPTLTIHVQDTYASQTVTSASSSGGSYTSFKAVMYLKGVNSTFAMQPEAQIAHEYGHAWTLYHLYLDHDGDWRSYLDTRWANADGSLRLSGDSRLDSSYAWDRKEIIADDYRLLFGSSLAISERPSHLNTTIPAPDKVTGLRNFLIDVWGSPA